MNLKASFNSALISPPKLPSSRKAEDFLGQVFTHTPSPESPLFRLLAGGELKAASPWSFDIRSIDCFMLLYTKKGCGKLLLNSQVYSLNAGTLLLLDCGQRFRIDIAIAPWEYQVLFVSTNSLSYYRQLFPRERLCLLQLPPYSESLLCMEKLSLLTPSRHIARQLSISSLLDQVISGCFISLLQTEVPFKGPAPYLEEMRTLFDNDFQTVYTLDDLEKRFGISKYRLCREFGAAFGMPPLQYLNHKRIDISRHLLCTTNHRIHEIGSMVGIENTNHFISLFKRYTGITPLEYRQRMTL